MAIIGSQANGKSRVIAKGYPPLVAGGLPLAMTLWSQISSCLLHLFIPHDRVCLTSSTWPSRCPAHFVFLMEMQDLFCCHCSTETYVCVQFQVSGGASSVAVRRYVTSQYPSLQIEKRSYLLRQALRRGLQRGLIRQVSWTNTCISERVAP